MATTVCLYANAIGYPEGGGHLWVYLNWALGLRSLGIDVIWLEDAPPAGARRQRELLDVLKRQLAPFELDQAVALAPPAGTSLKPELADHCLTLEDAAVADLLLNLNYNCLPDVVGRFRRSALLDIDPGLVQLWMGTGTLDVSHHNVYFTIGETVGRPGGIPDCGLTWHYSPPAVHVPAWPVTSSGADASYTTVTHWWHNWEAVDGVEFDNAKRASFLQFADLPERVAARIELAVSLEDSDTEDRELLERKGWALAHPRKVSSTPDAYRAYVQASRGEFSCAKPSCMRLANAWISDRTICYLASGKPAIVQHTGDSGFLPDAEGLFRFRDLDEAVRAVNAAEGDYDRHATSARALAEHHFDAATVATRLLERAMA